MDAMIEKAKRGDPDAFVALIQEQMASMYKVARSILKSDEDAADAIQETILRCWEKLGQLREDQYFKTWLTRILIHQCYDLLKGKREVPLEEGAYDAAGTDGGFANIEWNEALASLDEKYRLVVVLYYVEGFKTREISGLLNIPEATVRTRLSRAREKFSAVYGIDEERRALS